MQIIPPISWRYFFDENPTPISVDAVAAIDATAAGTEVGSDKNLFIFRHNLRAVNTIDNPDNFDVSGQLKNCVTFDGTIAFTDGTGEDQKDSYKYDYLQYSTQTSNLNYFFTEKARKDGLSVNDAIKKGEDYAHKETYVQYDMDALGKSARDIMGIPDFVGWNSNRSNGDAVRNYAGSAAFNGKKDMISSDLSGNVARTADPNNGDGNVSVTINGAISGNTNDPVYCYLDESISQVNFNVNASNGRPLILVYMGNGKLQMNMSNGNTFRGIVYAPNVKEDEGVLINANGGTFCGSVIANAINLQGGKGTFRYEDFLSSQGSSGTTGSGTSSGSGSGKVSSSSKISLIGSPEGISWD